MYELQVTVAAQLKSASLVFFSDNMLQLTRPTDFVYNLPRHFLQLPLTSLSLTYHLQAPARRWDDILQRPGHTPTRYRVCSSSG